ncbi:MAG: Gfo/Idh/MocA family oxidoreductase [Clostridiales bacterium]|nr:Gfo/Idh/MocA family oxidoreductase [Clostridiales bacterium]
MAKNTLDDYKKDQKDYSIDTSKKVRIGIIGTGWIAGDHIREYMKMPDVELVAVADLIDGKAEAFLKKNGAEGVKVYRTDKELIDNEQLDAVSVCTYNMQHAPCTIYALEHGVNVLLEKPMCVTMEEAEAIMKAEKKSGKIVSVGFQPRFNPNMQMIKRIVESGELGKIYHIIIGGGRRRGIPTPYGTTFIEKETGGLGALGDIGCYALDMVLNGMGYPKPLRVSGRTTDYFGKADDYKYRDVFGVDDFAIGFVRLENDLTIDFKTAWAMNVDSMGDTIIMGTKAGLKIPSSGHWGSIAAPLKLYRNIGDAAVETVIPMAKEPEEGVFYWKIRTFLDAVKYGGPAPVPTSQVIYNQAILSGVAESAKLGKEVEIVIPEI